MKEIKSLILWLQNHSFIKEAQQLEEVSEEPKEWSEPWHEEAVEDFDVPFPEPNLERQYQSQFEKTFKPQIYGKNFQSQSHILKEVLKKEDFKLISGPNENAFLGSGYYGHVFNGVYQGKPAAAKVIISPKERFNSAQTEVSKWNQINHNAPPNLKKYMPTIFYTNQACLDNMTYENFRKNNESAIPCYEIIIMEKLYPLNSHLQEIFSRFGQSFDQSIKNIFKDPNYLYEIAKTVTQTLNQDRENIPKLTPNQILKFLLTIDFNQFFNNELIQPKSKTLDLARAILNFLTEDMEVDEDNYYMLQEKIKKDLFKFLEPRVINSFDDFEYYKDFWMSSPETMNFYQALLDLEKNGIEWKDLHIDNLMQDQDGNLKFIDAGLFILQATDYWSDQGS